MHNVSPSQPILQTSCYLAPDARSLLGLGLELLELALCVHVHQACVGVVSAALQPIQGLVLGGQLVVHFLQCSVVVEQGRMWVPAMQ